MAYISQYTGSQIDTLLSSITNVSTDINNRVLKAGDTMSGNLIISKSSTAETSCRATNNNGSVELLTSTNRGVYDRTKTKWIIYTNGTNAYTDYPLYGAVWNDYAEFREVNSEIKPGQCVIENGDDTLSISTERLQKGAEIVSDTYGFAIGQTEKASTPIAVSGRVLAYTYEPKEQFKPGSPVCSGPNGTISLMTDQEARDNPWCIIGTVSAIPQYDIWGENNVKVDGRIWIRIR